MGSTLAMWRKEMEMRNGEDREREEEEEEEEGTEGRDVEEDC